MKKQVKRIGLELSVMFAVCQAILIVTGGGAFGSFRTWLMPTLMGMATGMMIMYGHKFMNMYIGKRISWLQSPVKSALLTFFSGTLLTIGLICLVNYVVLILISGVPFDEFVRNNWFAIKLALVMYFLASLVVHVFMFYSKWKNLAIEHEKQKHESLKLRFEALRNQVNPHFLFNSLSTLVQLIRTDPQKAIDFTGHLSETYRYIIDYKDKDLVSLATEMAFVDSYLALQRIRFGQNMLINNTISDIKNYNVIPVSVQMAVENIFKHNIVSREMPITIDLWTENGYLYIRNKLNPKKQETDRQPTGLATIRARYEYLSNRNCIFGPENGHFLVALPLLTTQNTDEV